MNHSFVRSELMRLKTSVCFSLFALLAAASHVFAEDSGRYPWLVVKGSLSDFTDKHDIIVKDFPTEEEARAYARQQEDALGPNERYKYTFIVRQRKEGEGKDQKEKIKIKPAKKVGDVLKDYKRNIENAWRRVTDAKTHLSKMTTRISDEQFKAVNGLIESYNAQVDQYTDFLEKNPGLNAKVEYPKIARVDPSDFVEKPATEKPDIAGTWTLNGDAEWIFEADGTWQISGTGNRGQWKKTGSGVAIRYAGAQMWIDLNWEGPSLVDSKGFVGGGRFKKK
jgi:hypothetical protein